MPHFNVHGRVLLVRTESAISRRPVRLALIFLVVQIAGDQPSRRKPAIPAAGARRNRQVRAATREVAQRAQRHARVLLSGRQ